MATSSRESPAERFRQALDLFDLAVDMVRQKHLRKRRRATEAELDAAVEAWLLTRRGAEHGDGEGRPGTWPRRG